MSNHMTIREQVVQEKQNKQIMIKVEKPNEKIGIKKNSMWKLTLKINKLEKGPVHLGKGAHLHHQS